MASYKDEKEKSVTGLTGSSISHINFISSVALATIVLHHTLQSRLVSLRRHSLIILWALLVLPLLLSMTLFANSPLLLTGVLLAVSAVLLRYSPAKEQGAAPLPAHSPNTQVRFTFPPSSSLTPLPSLTTYRAHMMLMTILAILAVDFPVFPRELAKCETFGVSLMDLGVGSFVFSQGIVSLNPILKNPNHLVAPVGRKIVAVSRKCLPIILLGLVRVMLVKRTEYPEHVSEYGVHWNFFVTLALLPVMEVLLHPLMVYFSVGSLGIMIALFQQFVLSYLGRQDFILNAPRTNLLSANKEGVTSLLGYFSIHLLGLSLGTIILPPSPSYFRRLKKRLRTGRDDDEKKKDDLHRPRKMNSIVANLCAFSFVWWLALGFVRWFKLDGGNVSRQMVNISYVLWIAAFNTTFVLGYVAVDMALGVKDDIDLFSAINKNGLAIFLVANMLTGLVNVTIQTLYTPNSYAMVILSTYSFLVCLVAWISRGRRLIPF